MNPEKQISGLVEDYTGISKDKYQIDRVTFDIIQKISKIPKNKITELMKKIKDQLH